MSVLVKFDPAFTEDAVFLTIKTHEKHGDYLPVQSFNAQKDLLYEKGSDEKAFREFYENYFQKLGLGVMFENALLECVILKDSGARISVRRVFSRRHEGSELYVDGNSKTVLLSVRPERLAEPEVLKKFLYHELLRVSDMLDPAFEYSPRAPLEGVNDAENELIRERFSALWNRSIRLRLDRNVGSSKRIPEWTQKELIEMARDGIREKNNHGGGFICPLCGFPSFDRAPSMDSCRQCFEMGQVLGASFDGRK